eukprot:6011377-Prymnesium_polylepis.1
MPFNQVCMIFQYLMFSAFFFHEGILGLINAVKGETMHPLHATFVLPSLKNARPSRVMCVAFPCVLCAQEFGSAVGENATCGVRLSCVRGRRMRRCARSSRNQRSALWILDAEGGQR